ncbi:PF03932 family protein CutC [Pectinophora gossypiella]|uniref:PF03932 family protein CutC n=1 Tax=Pectinophora gossypiella TaxID=13191 RepID=UPI00214E9966|nr:PF03932 family protein CutC [Pectinophora gossypiella]
MLLEVCVDNLESATTAVYSGADEIEVCSFLSEGGLTPAPELVYEILDMINFYMDTTFARKKPKVNVMIRCRPGWDFCYNEIEMAKMVAQMADFKSMDVDRFVFGAITADVPKEVDVAACKKILAEAHPKPVTFHRAFDMCPNVLTTMEQIIKLGFDRLLTSGQKDSASHVEAIKTIRYLQDAYADRIQIMPGGGINAENAQIFAEMGCKIVHGSCRPPKQAPGEEHIYSTDGDIVQAIKEIVTF